MNLDDFIQRHAKYLTIADMAEETGLSGVTIRKHCKAHNIIPIKSRDQAKKFIRDHCTKKTPEQIAALGRYRMTYLKTIYKELNLSFCRQKHKVKWHKDGTASPPDLFKQQPLDTLTEIANMTPREVFSGYKIFIISGKTASTYLRY